MSEQLQMKDLTHDRLREVVGSLLIDALAPTQKDSLVQKAQTVGAPVGPYLHGPGGLFGVRGLDRPIISTHIQFVSSLAANIRVRSASTRPGEGGALNPLAPYITGFLRSDQQEKNNVCDDPEEAGSMKTCILTTVFGRKEFKSRQLEVNHVGQTINRGEFLDNIIVNSPLVAQLGGLMAQQFALGNQAGLMAGREMLMRIVEMGVSFQRWICPQVFTGNPANNSAGGGYQEFMGLDLLISRNKPDAVSGAQCESLYSQILDMNFSNVQDVNAANNIFLVIKRLIRYFMHKADQQNMDPLREALVMRKGLFDAIVDIWPCVYMTDRCMFTNSNANGSSVINDDQGIRLRDQMRNGKYLLIDGQQIPVIIDDCITEETAADNAAIPVGGYSSDIYVVPLTARGGTVETMFWEFFDYNGGTIPAIQDARAFPFYWSSDSGRYLWSIKSPDNWCLEVIAKMQPRLRLMTPQFAARITNVVYIPEAGLHFDDPLPSQPYWLDGGNPTGYPLPSPYSEFNLDGPGIGA